jgi:hypothetical protein
MQIVITKMKIRNCEGGSRAICSILSILKYKEKRPLFSMGWRSERHSKNNYGTEGAGGTASSGRDQTKKAEAKLRRPGAELRRPRPKYEGRGRCKLAISWPREPRAKQTQNTRTEPMQTRDKLGRDRNKHGIERPRGPGRKWTQDTDNLGIGSWEESPGLGS